MNQVLNCLIADDEPLARRLIREFLGNVEGLAIIGEGRDGGEVREYLKSGERIDLLILDIQMPHVTGIKLVEELPYDSLVIFTTAYEKYAVRAFDLNVVDYVVKPFSRDRLLRAIARAREIYQLCQGTKGVKEAIFLRTAYRMRKFLLKDILFVEGMKEYVKVQARGEDYFLVYMRMKEIEEQLGEGFLRIHRSFIVNLAHVEVVGLDCVWVLGRRIPVSRSRIKELKRSWMG